MDLKALGKEAGAALLAKLGVKGAQAEREKLSEDVKGHALTLNLIGAYLAEAYAGDIRKRDLMTLKEADAERGGHAFAVMDSYVRWFESEGETGLQALAMLRLTGLFDRPADAGPLVALWSAPAIEGLTEPIAPLNEAQRNIVLKRLEGAKLVTASRGASGALVSLDAHPLLREYFATDLKRDRGPAWKAGHRRLYEHFVATTAQQPEPTAENLLPLYQAVIHGCKAGLHQEACDDVYCARIRGESASQQEIWSIWRGALGAVEFFRGSVATNHGRSRRKRSGFAVPRNRFRAALSRTSGRGAGADAARLRHAGRAGELDRSRRGLEQPERA